MSAHAERGHRLSQSAEPVARQPRGELEAAQRVRSRRAPPAVDRAGVEAAVVQRLLQRAHRGRVVARACRSTSPRRRPGRRPPRCRRTRRRPRRPLRPTGPPTTAPATAPAVAPTAVPLSALVIRSVEQPAPSDRTASTTHVLINRCFVFMVPPFNLNGKSAAPCRQPERQGTWRRVALKVGRRWSVAKVAEAGGPGTRTTPSWDSADTGIGVRPTSGGAADRR